MEVFRSKQTQNDLIQKNMLATRKLNTEVKKLKASTDNFIQDISFQQKQLKKKYSSQLSRKSNGFTSPIVIRKNIKQPNLAPKDHQLRPKSSNTILPTRSVMSASSGGKERCSSCRSTRPKSTTQGIPHIVVNHSPSPVMSATEIRPLSSPRAKVTSPSSSRNMSPLPPRIVIDDDKEYPTSTTNFQQENNLHLPAVHTRSNSMPNVLDVNLFSSLGSRKSEFIDLKESNRTARSSIITSLDETSLQLMSRSRSDSFVHQRRRSINISVDVLIRDLWHGIQHAELGSETERTWAPEKQSEWDSLKSCRYLRIRNDPHSYDSGSEDTTSNLSV